MTQQDGLEPIAGRGIAATNDGSVKSRRLGQICLEADSQALARGLQAVLVGRFIRVYSLC